MSRTWGWVYPAQNHDEGDEVGDWNAPKVALSLGDATAAKQKVEMLDFPNNYTDLDLLSLWGVQSRRTTTRGFGETRPLASRRPMTLGGGPDRRTYVGIDAAPIGSVNRVYIVNASGAFTVSEAEAILEAFGSVFESSSTAVGALSCRRHDLDGSPTTIVASSIDRKVPDALAVYLAP